MTYTLSTSMRNAGADAEMAKINIGSANAAGAIQMRNATTLIASLAFNNPAFGAAAAGVAQMDTTGVIDGTVVAAGPITIDRFRVVDRDGTTVLDGAAGSVALSGADINLSSVSVNLNDVIEVTGLSWTVPATGP